MEAKTTKISDGVTIVRHFEWVGFRLPTSYRYTVLETGEKFTGPTGRTAEDYMQWKARLRLASAMTASPWTSTTSFTRPPPFRKEEPMDRP